jgi:hypothetical protein
VQESSSPLPDPAIRSVGDITAGQLRGWWDLQQ